MRVHPGGGSVSGTQAHVAGVGLRILAAAVVPAAYVLLWGALAWRRGGTPIMVPAAAGAAILAGALAWMAARTALHRLKTLESQRDAFYEEFTRLSKIASLGEVCSSIAHDLSNPLAIINEETGWVSDLISGHDPGERAAGEEIKNSAEQIRIQVGRSREIIRRVLSWARDTQDADARTHINDLLAKTLYLVEGDLTGRGIRVVKRFAEDLPPAEGAAAELRQVFLNLVKNALDAMDAGGVLTLETRHGGGMTVVSVRDTGRGMAPEILSKIFDPFFTTKPEGSGSGLGLPIAFWIVRKLGGRLEVDSKPGAGTAFTVYLPAAGAAPAAKPDKEAT